MSDQPVVLATWNASSEPLQAFHCAAKSLMVMGVPSSHTASGLYFTVTICGSSLVISAETTVSGLMTTAPVSSAMCPPGQHGRRMVLRSASAPLVW